MKNMIYFIVAIFVLFSDVYAIDPDECGDEIYSGELYQKPIADGLYLTMAFSNNASKIAGTPLEFDLRRLRAEYSDTLPWIKYYKEVSRPIDRRENLDGFTAALSEAMTRFSDIFTRYYPPYCHIWVCFLTSKKFENLDSYKDWAQEPSVMAKTVQMAFAVYWLDEDFLLSEQGMSEVKSELKKLNVAPELYLKDCPFSHHIGIHRSPLYEGPKIKNISLALHAYAARVTQKVRPSKKMLSFLPTSKMQSICEQSLDPDYVGQWHEFAEKVPDLTVDAYRYYVTKSDKAKRESPINSDKPALKPGVSLDNYSNTRGILISLSTLSEKLEHFLQPSQA